MAQGRITDAQEAASETSGGVPPDTATADGRKRTVGVRFVYDACANDQQIKCLIVMDGYTCECLAIVAESNQDGLVDRGAVK